MQQTERHHWMISENISSLFPSMAIKALKEATKKGRSDLNFGTRTRLLTQQFQSFFKLAWSVIGFAFHVLLDFH